MKLRNTLNNNGDFLGCSEHSMTCITLPEILHFTHAHRNYTIELFAAGRQRWIGPLSSTWVPGSRSRPAKSCAIAGPMTQTVAVAGVVMI